MRVVNKVSPGCQADMVRIILLWSVFNNNSGVCDCSVTWDGRDLFVCEDKDCVSPWSVSRCVTLGKISKFLAKGTYPCVVEERSFWSVLYLVMASPIFGWITAKQCWGMNGGMVCVTMARAKLLYLRGVRRVMQSEQGSGGMSGGIQCVVGACSGSGCGVSVVCGSRAVVGVMAGELFRVWR